MTGYICNGSMTIDERKEKMQRVYELRAKNKTVMEISNIVGVHKTTVYKWLRIKHLSVGEGRRKYDCCLIDRIAEMYQSMNRKQIAKSLNMDGLEVTYIINAYGIRKNESLSVNG